MERKLGGSCAGSRDVCFGPRGQEELEEGKLEALQGLGEDGRDKPGTAPEE